MGDSMQVVKILIERYDYGGALEVLSDMGLKDSDAAVMINACRYAVNFDFASAKKLLTNLSDDIRYMDMAKTLKKNIESLNEGNPDALFSELLENLKFQVKNEKYIDFLGRVYRFKEAVYKYMFIKAHLDKRTFNFHIRFMQKKEILKILRNHYKIYNSNLVHGINSYFRKHAKHDPNVLEIIQILNTEKMNQLIELRHESLIGHGFRGVSFEEIQRVYGDPYMVLDDFRECLYLLDIDIFRYKYTMVNDFILDMLKRNISDEIILDESGKHNQN